MKSRLENVGNHQPAHMFTSGLLWLVGRKFSGGRGSFFIQEPLGMILSTGLWIPTRNSYKSGPKPTSGIFLEDGGLPSYCRLSWGLQQSTQHPNPKRTNIRNQHPSNRPKSSHPIHFPKILITITVKKKNLPTSLQKSPPSSLLPAAFLFLRSTASASCWAPTPGSPGWVQSLREPLSERSEAKTPQQNRSSRVNVKGSLFFSGFLWQKTANAWN